MDNGIQQLTDLVTDWTEIRLSKSQFLHNFFFFNFMRDLNRPNGTNQYFQVLKSNFHPYKILGSGGDTFSMKIEECIIYYLENIAIRN